MVNSGFKLDLGWFEAVLPLELDGKDEDPSLVGAVPAPQYNSLPVEHIFCHGPCGAQLWGGGVPRKVEELLLEGFSARDSAMG